MSNFQITGICTELPEQKRLYLPGIEITSKCPKCGEPFAQDLESEYLSYGDLSFTAYCCECDHEWSCELEVKIELTVKAPK